MSKTVKEAAKEVVVSAWHVEGNWALVPVIHIEALRDALDDDHSISIEEYVATVDRLGEISPAAQVRAMHFAPPPPPRRRSFGGETKKEEEGPVVWTLDSVPVGAPVRVDSSVVAAVAWLDEEELTLLEVHIAVEEDKPQRVYWYFGVPKERFVDFLNSESKGKFYNTEIKGKYDSERVV